MQPVTLAVRSVGPCLLASLLASSSACGDLAHQSEAVRISPEPLIEIGEMEGAEAYLFSSIGQAFLLEDGRVVVSDEGVNEIRVFGPDGTFLNSIGRSGEGPGEFSGVTGLWLTPDALIGLWDRGNLRISTYRPDGELVSTNRLRVEGEEEYSVTPEVLFGPFGNGDMALASLEFGGSPDTPEAIPDRWVLARFGPGGEPRGALGDLRGMRRLRGQPLPFTPLPRVAVLGDSLFAADGYEAGIDVRGPDGAVGRTIILPTDDRSADTDSVWSALEAELRARNREMYLGMLERLPRSDEFPQIGGLLADDRGLLWVKLYDAPGDALWLGHGPSMRPGAGGEWRLVRPDGDILGTVRIPDGLSPLHITYPDFGLSVSGIELLRLALRNGWILAVLPNLAMVMTCPALGRARGLIGGWVGRVLGAVAASALGLGVFNLLRPFPITVDGDLVMYGHLGLAYWAWSAAFATVAVALWLRDREWASTRPKKSLA